MRTAIRKLLPVPYTRYKNKDARRKYSRDYMRKYRTTLKSKGIERKWNSAGYLQKLRTLALEALGGPVCINCGCTELKILEINHKNGGGRKEFRTKNSAQHYRDILSGKSDKDLYEVTCRICNALHYVKDIMGVNGHKVTWKMPM